MRRIFKDCWDQFFDFESIPFNITALLSSISLAFILRHVTLFSHLIAWSDALYAYMSLPVRYTTS